MRLASCHIKDNEEQNSAIPSGNDARNGAGALSAVVMVERRGKELPPDITFDSVELALEEVQRLIKWLGYVAEHEYTEGERNRLISVCRRFAGIAQPIANKYMD